MTLRTGHDYLRDLDSRSVEVAVGGEIIRDGISRHRAFSPTARSYADTFDAHLSSAADALVAHGDDHNDDAAYSFSLHVPRSAEELAARTRATAQIAELSFGHLLRTPDHAHALVTAFGAASAWFSAVEPAFGERVSAYLSDIRRSGRVLGYALSLPEVNRQPDGSDQLGGQMAVRVVEHRSDGIVLDGARMLATSGPLCDEILLPPATVLRNGADEAPYAFAVAVPVDGEGVRFIARSTEVDGDAGRISRRFDEVETAIVLDHVFVPHERVFLLGSPAACNDIYRRTGAAALLVHQATVRRTVKADFYASLAAELARLLGVDHHEWVVDLVAESAAIAASARTALQAAEAGAAPNEWGMWEPDWRTLASARIAFASHAGRLPQILQEIGGQRLLMSPDPAASEVVAADIATYFQARFLPGAERLHLSRLVSDLSLSGFAARHALAEAHLFGEPRRLTPAPVNDEASREGVRRAWDPDALATAGAGRQ